MKSVYMKIMGYALLMLALIVGSVIFIMRLPAGGDYTVYRDFATIITISCVLIVASVLFLVFFTRRKLETVFIIAYISLGIVYTFIFTPFSSPDEDYHLRQSTRYTNYLFLDNDNMFVYDSSKFEFEGATNHSNRKEAYRTIMETLFAPGSTAGELVEYEREFKYPIQYLPQTIGLTLGKILPVSGLMEFYFGRLFNLLFSAVLLYFALKIIPKYKATFIVIALLPMTLTLSASYNYDAFTNAMSMLLIALLLREIYSDEKLKTGRYILIVIVAMLMAPAKFAYMFFIFFIFFIPVSNFKNKTDYLVKSVGAVALVFIYTAINFFLDHYIAVVIYGMGEVNWEGVQNYTNADIFRDPMHIARMLLNTTVARMDYYIKSAFGYILSGVSLFMNINIIYGFMVLYVLTIFSRESEIELGSTKDEVKIRLMSAGIIILGYLAIHYAMLVGWTSTHHIVIQGVQGRYFIPLMLPIAMVFSNKIFGYKTNLDKFVLSACVVLNVVAVYDILIRTIMA